MNAGWIAALALVLAAPAGAAERIVVTGTRVARAVLEEPAATARLEADELQLIAADHPSEALNRLAGVFIHRNSGQEHLTAIRSPVLTGGAGAGSFLYLEDGVPLRAAGFANVNGLFESVTELAEAIEVVRGPGSALYGSNAVHGMINVLTPTPDADAVRLSFAADTIGRRKGEASVERRGFYFGFAGLDEDGWRASSGVKQEKALARWDAGGAGWKAATTFAFVNLEQETAGFAEGPDAYADDSVRRANPNPEAYRDAKAARLQSRVTFEKSSALTLAVTPYARWTEMTFLQHFLPYQGTEENGHWSLGAQTAAYWTPDGPWSLVAGLDAETSTGFLTETQDMASFGPFPQGVHYDYEVRADVAAAYAQATRDLGEDLTLEAGLRAEWVRYDYDTAAPAGVNGRFLVPADRGDDYLLATPKLALTWRPADAQAVTLRLARGARAPQTSDLYRLQNLQTGAPADVETLDSVELGWRGDLGNTFLELTAFHMDKDGFFFRDADGLNVADAKTRHQGIEAAIDAGIAPGLRAILAATYARHTYRFDRPLAAPGSESISSGDDVDTAPRTLGDARLVWTPFDALTAELEWVHVGRYYTDAANDHRYPGHDIFNLRARWRATPRLAVTAALRNLADEAYAERADFAFGTERYFPGEERALTLGVTSAF